MMKRIGIFGAGQAGIIIGTWMGVDSQLICFIDNNVNRQGEYIGEYEIVSLQDALAKNLDAIWIAVLNKEASVEIASQLRTEGYEGDIKSILELKAAFDLRVSALRLIAKEIKAREIEGDVAELGVYKGVLAAEINRQFPERTLYLFDTFEGFDDRDLTEEPSTIKGLKTRRCDFSDTSEAIVLGKLPHKEKAIVVKGYFPESLGELSDYDSLRFAFVSLDPDLYEPVKNGLEYFYPRLTRGGVIMVHDYNSAQFPNVRIAVNEYCEKNELMPVPLMDLHGTAIIIKQ